MKNLLLLTTLVTLNIHANDCKIKLLTKTPNAKTFYLITGDRLATDVVHKISQVCTIEKTLMSTKLLTELKIKDLEKRLKKAKGLK